MLPFFAHFSYVEKELFIFFVEIASPRVMRRGSWARRKLPPQKFVNSLSIHFQQLLVRSIDRTLDFLSEFHFLSDNWAHTYSIASTRAPTKRRIFIIGMNVTLSNPNLATKLISYKISYALYTFLKLSWLIILAFAFQICMWLWMSVVSGQKYEK